MIQGRATRKGGRRPCWQGATFGKGGRGAGRSLTAADDLLKEERELVELQRASLGAVAPAQPRADSLLARQREAASLAHLPRLGWASVAGTQPAGLRRRANGVWLVTGP